MNTVKKVHSFSLIFLMGMVFCFAQGKRSSGDDYFFQYQYQSAVRAYEAEMVKNALTDQQLLNLADSYFETNNFNKASETYLDLFKKEVEMGTHHFNKLLQSLAKTSDKERMDAFLATMSTQFQREFLENFEFNTQLLENGNMRKEMDFQIFNLTGNSPQSDFAPSFYREKLLFSSGRTLDKKRRYEPAGEGYLNIYEANLRPNGQVVSALPFKGIPSSNYHKATPFYSERLNSVLYVLSNTEDGELAFDDNGKNALSIGMQTTNGAFRLLLKDLSTSFYYPFYDEASGKLYFSANFEDGYGGTDIYYVYTNNGQIMSAPINLGPRINSPGNEIAPFVFEDSFYFSSDVFYGLGGMDIYKSTVQGESFSIPINLGNQINSSDDDFGLIIRNEGEGLLGYFASNRPGGKGGDDLYGFKVNEKPGLRTLTFKGKVVKPYDNSSTVDRAAVRLWSSNGTMLAETYSDDKGNYRMEIPWEEEVLLESSKERFSTFSKKLSSEELEGLQNSSYDIEISLYDDLVEEKEGQKVVKMGKFLFGKSQTALTDEIKKELDKVVTFVEQFPSAQLRIETYTDSRGGSSTNFRLTQSRSDAIKRYLIQQGVPNTSILYSIGYGEDKILNNCTNGVFCLEVLHQQNQRSLVVVLNDNVLFN
ncbi:OmpA family protein [Flagellimonas nanhaiensis]|uniref:OmpA family protein n=1 Tax=Flagellimonas nanhaiensis TaxID=2292706 RepID=A0A371JNF3_9FLAO|nr:OmpA family protein [Allomuricauda nanhaiensis]RDY58775.1 OmpA family protein [Allomuricauda nanhaiensis]